MIRNLKSPNTSQQHDTPQRSSSQHYSRSHPHVDRSYLQERTSGYKDHHWQQQSANDHSSTVFHLHEEIRLLKLKNSHLQQHMDRMQMQYEQLRKTIELMQINQKQQLRRNNQLIHRINTQQNRMIQVKNQLQLLKLQNEQLRADSKTAKFREQQLRRRLDRLKQTQFNLNTKISEYENQNQKLKSKNNEKDRYTSRNRDQLKIITEQLQKKQDQINMLKQTHKREIEKMQNTKKQTENTEIEKNIKQLDKQQHKIRELTKQQQIAENEYKQQRQKIQKQYDIMKVESENLNRIIKQLQKQIQKGNQQINYLRNQIQIKNRAIQNSKQQKILQSQQNRIKKISESQNQSKQQQYNNLQAQNIKLTQQLATIKITLKSKQSQISALNHQISEQTNNQNSKQMTNPKNSNQQMNINSQKSPQVYENLTDLQKQYNQQLQALRRLILYQRYSNQSNDNVYVTTSTSQKQDRIRQQYQRRIDSLVKQYQQVQHQLLTLQQQLIRKHHNSSYDITFRTSQEERQLYIQAVRKWQIAFQEQQAIYEAKLVSKQEQINLLNLKLTNIE